MDLTHRIDLLQELVQEFRSMVLLLSDYADQNRLPFSENRQRLLASITIGMFQVRIELKLCSESGGHTLHLSVHPVGKHEGSLRWFRAAHASKHNDPRDHQRVLVQHPSLRRLCKATAKSMSERCALVVAELDQLVE